jgi:nucleoside-diphosphate-sugar epimerase
MRVLVTGSQGYVGSVLVPFLRAAGHEVHGMDIGYFADGLLYGVDDGPVLRGDVRDEASWARLDLAAFDGVVHLAALSNDPLGELDEGLTYAINRDASVALAARARAAGVRRFVFASSCSVYGLGDDAARVETSALSPQTAYAKSKIEVEAPVLAMRDERFSPTGLRFATAFGASPRLRLDIVVNNLTGCAIAQGAIRLESDGTPWRPLVHVEDMARTILACLEADAAAVAGEVFNVGREDNTLQVRGIAELVAAAIPGAALSIGSKTGADTRSYQVSFAKLRAHLPHLALRWSVEEGIAELARAMRTNGLTAERFAGREFVRLRQLRHLMDTGAVDGALRMRA